MKIKTLTYALSAAFGLIGPALFLRNINLSDWGMLPVEPVSYTHLTLPTILLV